MKMKKSYTLLLGISVLGLSLYAMKSNYLSRGPASIPKPKTVSLTQEDRIKAVIQDNLNQIEDCYKMRIRDGLVRTGDLKVSWEIDEEGNPLNIEEVRNDLRDDPLFDCSSEMIGNWRFPKGIYFKINYAFHLKPKDEKMDYAKE